MKVALVVPAVALVALAAPAYAQSHCYKGACDGLMTEAVGSNYDQATLGRGYSLPPLDFAGVAGGSVDVSYLGRTDEGPCRGRATALPDHTFTLAEATRVLEIAVQSRGDTVLVVHGPDGWRCNDDGEDHNPSLGGSFSPGTYRVWIASYDGDYYDYRLSLRTRRGSSAPPQSDPPRVELDRDAQEGSYEGAIASAAQLAEGLALYGRPGGDVDLETLGRTRTGPCDGFAQEAPQHVITLTEEMAQLAFEVDADVDTTLAIHGPGGWRCNDDGEGLNPALADRFRAGTYRIWVGTYRLDDVGEYTLSLFDVRAPAPEPIPVEVVFTGRFESMDVRFTGDSVDGVYRECMAYSSGAPGLDWVDDVQLGSRSVRNTFGYWSSDALCALAALNAEGAHGAWVASGVIEEVPVRIVGESAADIREQCLRYAGDALGDTWIDDIEVGGQSRRNDFGYWSVEETCMMVSTLATGP